MSLLPTTDPYLEDIPKEKEPDVCHRITKNRLIGEIDQLSSVKQACFCRLATEKRIHEIYSDNYGIQTFDLIGKDYSYTASELMRRITEALKEDDRITDVTDFDITRPAKNSINLAFVVKTIYGAIPYEYTAKILE